MIAFICFRRILIEYTHNVSIAIFGRCPRQSGEEIHMPNYLRVQDQVHYTHTYNPTFVTYCVFVYQLIVYAMGKWNTFVFYIDNAGDFFLSPSNNLLNVPSINPDVWLINMRNATIAHRMPLVRVQPFNQIPHENIMYVRPVS